MRTANPPDVTASLTPAVLAAAGAALYGDRWQNPLARDLGVADRTMRRWVAGQYPVPDGVRGNLMRLLRERGEDISAVLAQVCRD